MTRVFATTRDFRESRVARTPASQATKASQAIKVSAAMMGILGAPRTSSKRRCDVTGPFFWARPVTSSVATATPSIRAAAPRMALVVVTPSPPTPATRTLRFLVMGPSARSARSASTAPSTAAQTSSDAFRTRGGATPFFPVVSIQAKEGQKPLTQEKSLLQRDWLILRFSPNAVSTGSTAMQDDWTEQSPQPSQTASLMKRRFGGSGARPRRRFRRFSAAQAWS
mmetsp:Transcript_13632/g.44451  ORF Transcript_13632/g.44451 Transcript_13632/m.44451 type:complete len:225 (+) Transcript_13632:520-1194(+)